MLPSPDVEEEARSRYPGGGEDVRLTPEKELLERSKGRQDRWLQGKGSGRRRTWVGLEQISAAVGGGGRWGGEEGICWVGKRIKFIYPTYHGRDAVVDDGGCHSSDDGDGSDGGQALTAHDGPRTKATNY